jgi:hypothetical protein
VGAGRDLDGHLPYVRSVNTDRHFSRDMQVWESGTATIVLNNFDARFSPSNLAGPYVSYGITGISPWRPVRIRATWAGVTYDLFRGYALNWNESYDQPSPNGGGAYMTVSCVDEMASLARFDGLAQRRSARGVVRGAVSTGCSTTPATAARDDRPGQRHRAGHRPVGQRRRGAEADDRLRGRRAVRQQVGAVVFERSTALVDNTRSSTIQATYGDGPGELPYSDVQPAYDGDLLVNIVSWSRVGGTTRR